MKDSSNGSVNRIFYHRLFIKVRFRVLWKDDIFWIICVRVYYPFVRSHKGIAIKRMPYCCICIFYKLLLGFRRGCDPFYGSWKSIRMDFVCFHPHFFHIPHWMEHKTHEIDNISFLYVHSWESPVRYFRPIPRSLRQVKQAKFFVGQTCFLEIRKKLLKFFNFQKKAKILKNTKKITKISINPKKIAKISV